jgi:hypothetical protein
MGLMKVRQLKLETGKCFLVSNWFFGLFAPFVFCL